VPPALDDLELLVNRYLLLADPDAFRVTLAAAAAHSLPGDPVWLLLVAPPSGAKTELVSLLYPERHVYALSELTARTFASGLKTDEDYSLLSRLTNNILIIKDFTTILEMHREERQVVLAQLREIYDGRYDKTWGTGKELHWTGRISLIAGVTPVIDKHYSVMSVLGQRFILFRLRQPDRKQAARRAIQNSLDDEQRKKELARQVASFIQSLPETAPEIPEWILDAITQHADFVTRARSAVVRDNYSREIESTPEPEMPGRFGRQLASLACGLAKIHGRVVVNDEDLARVTRVGLDCIPPLRLQILRRIALAPAMKLSELNAALDIPSPTVRRCLEDLRALGFLTVTKAGVGRTDEWRLVDEARDTLKTLALRERRPLRQTSEPACESGESPAGSTP
jgi:hypothetical protein